MARRVVDIDSLFPTHYRLPITDYRISRRESGANSVPRTLKPVDFTPCGARTYPTFPDAST